MLHVTVVTEVFSTAGKSPCVTDDPVANVTAYTEMPRKFVFSIHDKNSKLDYLQTSAACEIIT